MNILITGGAGFVGSHTARALIDRGDNVVVLDDFNDVIYSSDLKKARLDNLFEEGAKPELVTGSILDRDVLEKVFDNNTFDVIVHLAALANPGKSVGAEREYCDVNVAGTIEVLKAAKQHGVKRVIFAGSSSVYNDEKIPFSEDTYPLRPRSPYGASKAAAELFCENASLLDGINVTVLRFFSVYGPWGRPDMAPFIFAERILRGEKIELTKDDRKRDLTFITDVVPAVVAATDKDFGFTVFNIGRGEPVELRGLVKAIEFAAGKDAIVADRPAPAGEMLITFADTTKAQKLLGYQPKVSIKEGAQKLVEWMRDWYIPFIDNK